MIPFFWKFRFWRLLVSLFYDSLHASQPLQGYPDSGKTILLTGAQKVPVAQDIEKDFRWLGIQSVPQKIYSRSLGCAARRIGHISKKQCSLFPYFRLRF